MAQVQELDGLDPAARQQLLEDLKQTEPRLWQDVIRQFRATLAFRQKLQQSDSPTDRGPADPQASTSAPPGPPQNSLAMASASATGKGPAAPTVSDRFSQDPRPNQASRSAIVQAAVAEVVPAGQGPPGKASTQSQVAAKPAPTVTQAEATDRVSGGEVKLASCEEPAQGTLQAELQQAIHAVEGQLSDSPQSAAEVAEHARLRMLYLLAGRRDDALRPIPSTTPSVQDFWSKELFGLATLLDAQQDDRPERRAAQTHQQLSEALTSLSRSSALVVRNLAFSNDIQGFGAYRSYTENKFTPGQEVLLYAEIENFTSEATPSGYVTSLSCGCQIFDSRGQRVAQHEFKIEDHCRNQRRDFYIDVDLYMPKRIYNGLHSLQLTVEDLKSRKIGQQTIEFMIVDAEK